MATGTLDNPAPSLEERYGPATSSSNLRLDENRRGAVNLIIAAGVASRPDKDGVVKASRALGGALTRLLTEWHQVAKPQRMPVMSFKDWMEVVPWLVVDGKRVRDVAGARENRAAQQEASDAAYKNELMLLAQKLPSRVLVLRNGFTVTGESACASPENFDAAIGRKIARENAVAKVWPLMGYALKTELARPADAPAAFRFDMRQVVQTKDGLGTVIGRTDSAGGEPTYLVRDFESESLTEGVVRKESELLAF